MHITLCPNMGTQDFLTLFQSTNVWTDTREQIKAFKFISQAIRADAPLDKGPGPNVYHALKEVEAFRKLANWGIEIWVEAGAVKEGKFSCEPFVNEIDDIIGRVADGEGALHTVAADEPLRSCVQGAYPGKDQLELTDANVARIAEQVASFVVQVSEKGPRVGIMEAYPYHTPETLSAYLRAVRTEHAAPVAWFELDLDRYGVRDQGKNDKRVRSDLAILRSTCGELDIPFRVLVMGQRNRHNAFATSDDEYAADAREHAQRVYAWFDGWPAGGVTIQSWHEFPQQSNIRQIPHNLPPTSASTLTSLVGFVIKPPAIRKKSRWEELAQFLSKLFESRTS